jgi:DNA invertase Pin-like site-specific DNA recombinase
MNALPRSLDDLRGLRAARWMRESTAGQVDRYGPAAQRELQQRAIEQWGLVDTGRAWEVAHSGWKIAKHPAWSEMLAAAGVSFDVLVVGYASRFARSLEAHVDARRAFHAAGAVILFADERILSSDEDGWEHWAREAVEAEAYSRRLARRIREAYAAKFRLGDQGGPPGLGFRRTPAPEARLAIDEAIMPRVVAVFERYATGTASITDLEGEFAIPRTAIRMILQNPLYNGWAVRNRRSPDEARAAAPWRSAPPVSDELWSRVQKVRRQRTTGGGGRTKRVHMLVGRLWCVCGRRVKGDVASQRSGRIVRRYRHMDPCERWPQGSYVAQTFEGAITDQLSRMQLDDALLTSLRALAGQEVATPSSEEPRRKQLEREIEATALALARGQLSANAFLAEHDRIKGELSALAQAPVPTAAMVAPDEAVRALRDLKAAWSAAGEAERQQLVRAIFARITVSGERIVEEELTPMALGHGLALALPEYVALARRTGFEPATFGSGGRRSIH